MKMQHEVIHEKQKGRWKQTNVPTVSLSFSQRSMSHKTTRCQLVPTVYSMCNISAYTSQVILGLVKVTLQCALPYSAGAGNVHKLVLA